MLGRQNMTIVCFWNRIAWEKLRSKTYILYRRLSVLGPTAVLRDDGLTKKTLWLLLEVGVHNGRFLLPMQQHRSLSLLVRRHRCAQECQ